MPNPFQEAADLFKKEDRQSYTDFKSVESQRNDLVAEEFPEGPYGSEIQSASLGKSTPWRMDMRSPNRFDYENRELHEGIGRDYPGEDSYPDAIDEP
ncbi:hypothetical protein GT019_22070 [Paenibacillus sp. T1]|uniref:Cytosolic protein n=1 Tax=Paenibacillus glycinis TaxID=2697035 RepID=A0ABW9XVA8_9BACL|nr:hypothetical protein [Paenibacillus glycinis]